MKYTAKSNEADDHRFLRCVMASSGIDFFLFAVGGCNVRRQEQNARKKERGLGGATIELTRGYIYKKAFVCVHTWKLG